MNLGKEILEKLEILGQISSTSLGVTRYYLSKEYFKAKDVIENWMKEASLKTSIDSLGNLIGEYQSPNSNAKTLVIGSHQDSVTNGGKFDGIMGVILPIVCLKELLKNNQSIPCNLKIISFAYEEGVTYPNACFSSKALAGTFSKELLNLEYQGKKLSDALKENNFDTNTIENSKLKDIDAFLEIHIEQGPVLVRENLPVGIVSGIQGCNRYLVTLEGEAAHSGTIPMDMRKDAAVAMSEIIYKSTKLVETKENIVITFGRIEVFPGAMNIIPGKAVFTIDLRGPHNQILDNIMEEIKDIIIKATSKRNILYALEITNKLTNTVCSPSVIQRLEKSFENTQQKIFKLNSGAGHDTQEFANLTDVGMLFVRCVDGLSHNPMEDVYEKDLDVASDIIIDFIQNFY